MKSYQYSCCQVVNGLIVVLDLKTPVVSADTPTEALEQNKQFFIDHNCLPYRQVT